MRVVWSPRARSNLNDIFDYILAETPAAAAKVTDTIESRIRLLEQHPNIGRPGKITGTRELVVAGTNYIVVYRTQTRPARVQVIAVRHGARDWPEAFDC